MELFNNNKDGRSLSSIDNYYNIVKDFILKYFKFI